jgi:Ulp1 family protease
MSSLCRCERVIIPVHEKSHWTALMVDIKAKRLVYFDSLLRQNRRAVTEVKKWVADEAKVREVC